MTILYNEDSWSEQKVILADSLSVPGARFVDILTGPYPGSSNDSCFLYALEVYTEKEGGSLHIMLIEQTFVWITKLVISSAKCCRKTDALSLDEINSLMLIQLNDNKTILTVDLRS